jgi:hypothetical protein
MINYCADIDDVMANCAHNTGMTRELAATGQSNAVRDQVPVDRPA